MGDPLDALRPLMASHNPPLHALIVPSEDYHQSEYVSSRDMRREYVSGFSGSAGVALITMTEARLWTDGRYFVQAEQELSDRWTLMRMGEDLALENWISDHLPDGATVGVDPWCVSVDTAQRWMGVFTKKQHELVQLSCNLVDEVWKSRPPMETNPVIIHPVEFAGRAVAEKLKDLREKLTKENVCGIVLAALDEVAWSYNIRGTDVAYNPVVQAFAIVTPDLAFFYVDKKKVSAEVHSYMEENGVQVRDYSAVSTDVVSLAAKENQNRIWLDPGTCCYALYSNLNSDQVFLQQSPLALAKALKNPVELDGLRDCHIRDGAAVVQYLVWLDKQMQENYGAPGYFLEQEGTHKRKPTQSVKLTEVTVSDKLESFRASKKHFRGLSFPTISSVGPNAAINHYNPAPETCLELDAGKIYLCDSGAQYGDGTTDITRTVHFGKPSAHEKTCYTAVLKGHIALDAARFPNGTSGLALDSFARAPLWKYGLDYRHGTGHGIGSYLNVHEGPHSISFRPNALKVPLQASMTVTDEPGYYEDGSFGIRLENVLVVKDANTEFNFGDKGYLCFEHITWAPYQKKLMDLSLLSADEIEWVNTYHANCKEILAPYLDESEMAWLEKATEPVSVV
ncbi:hypothetical protein IFM89_005553 [Coptis chinensis]|uniref:Xaa-Pro aminopeptidase n=1 Tax=Coptis chinensis TaxID=261450 RepID=A0A835H317_9MAGN|nr:hypothetical protein IFM89_005553 [Coptis chinensis]